MTDNKIKPSDISPEIFLETIKNQQSRADAFTLLKMIKSITQQEPKMWGPSIIGFGTYHFKYESGCESDWFLTGFSPRSQNLSLYIMNGFEHYDKLMKKLGKYKTGKACLYITKLDDIDLEILEQLITESYNHIKSKHK